MILNALPVRPASRHTTTQVERVAEVQRVASGASGTAEDDSGCHKS